jgi:hypothetical protein
MASETISACEEQSADKLKSFTGADAGGLHSQSSEPLKSTGGKSKTGIKFALIATAFVLICGGVLLDLFFTKFDVVPRTADVVVRGDSIYIRTDVAVQTTSLLNSFRVSLIEFILCSFCFPY